MWQNTIYAYSKKKLNPNYLTKGNVEKMKEQMRKIGWHTEKGRE